jgi:hypothetical protein
MDCEVCHKSPPDVQLQRCSACQAAFYCSAEHQRAGWSAHKAACKSVQKARNAARTEVQADQSTAKATQKRMKAQVSCSVVVSNGSFLYKIVKVFNSIVI